MKNRATGQFMGNIRQIFVYLLAEYGKLSPSHLNAFEKVIEMDYDPVNPVGNIFNKVEDILE